MASKASESIPVRAGSTHLVAYTAHAPGGGEVHGIATVTAVDGRVPWAELAKIPGFREGDVIDHRDGERRPWLLGPGTDAPGHPVWCREHDDEQGDGRSVCWGEMTRIGGTDVQLTRGFGQGVSVWYYVEPQDQGEELTPAEARETALELREIAARLEELATQAEAAVAVSK